jgi:drug/metabolite transporter (DMT)-like permease
MSRNEREGLLLVLTAAMGYSILPIFTKSILASGLPPMDLAVWRFMFAAPAFWIILVARRVPLPERPLPRLRLLGLGGFLACAASLAFFGLQRIPAATYSVLFYTYPAMVVVLSMFLGERFGAATWLALSLTLAGVVLIVPDFGKDLKGLDPVGVALAFVNGLVVAVYYLLNSRLLRGHVALARASAWVITGAFLILAGAATLNGLRLPASASVWLLILGMAIFSTVLPVFALTTGIQKLGAARSAITGAVEPVLTVLLAMIFLSERMEPVQWLGGALILASVILLQTRRLETQPSRTADATASGD